MIWDIIGVFTKVRQQQRFFADSGTDKLNRSTTVILLISAALFILAGKFAVQSITCEKYEIGNYAIDMNFVHAQCLIRPLQHRTVTRNGTNHQKTSRYDFTYYPYLPLIAFLVAFCFYLPYLLWKPMMKSSKRSTIPIDTTGIIQMLRKCELYKTKELTQAIFQTSHYLYEMLLLGNMKGNYSFDEENNLVLDQINDSMVSRQRLILNTNNLSHGEKMRQWVLECFRIPLIVKYIFIKLVYLTNSILIFFILDYLLDLPKPFYLLGPVIYSRYHDLSMYFPNSIYDLSAFFPRNVFCTITTKQSISREQEYTFQCTLPANAFNEIVFVLIWAWLIIMVIFNVFSLFKWILCVFYRRHIIRQMLIWPITDRSNSQNLDRNLDRFVYKFLKTEGFLILMLIRSNTYDWHCRLIMQKLWDIYTNKLSKGEAEPHSEFHPNNKNGDETSHDRLIMSSPTSFSKSPNEDPTMLVNPRKGYGHLHNNPDSTPRFNNLDSKNSDRSFMPPPPSALKA